VFKLSPAGTVIPMYSFVGGSDGAFPAGLIVGTDGNLYGTTWQGGGASNAGTLFRITPNGAETVVYSFSGGSDGLNPNGGLIQGVDGNFYGTTANGGASGLGTVFSVAPNGTKTTLYSFSGGSDGSNPFAGVIQANDGNFYGTTQNGGADGLGTVFKITLPGVETVLYSFTGGADARNPALGLIQGSDGNLYGAAENGGASDAGTAFKITLGGTETVLYTFSGASGSGPRGALIQGSDGNLYGTTINSPATIFRLTTSGVITTLHTFVGSDGQMIYASPVQGRDGALYGVAAYGGANGDGTLFKVALQ